MGHDAPAPARPPGAFPVWLLSGALLATVVAPLCWPAGRDSFPWSSYPMFAHGRADAITRVDRLMAVRADGERRPVPPRLVANDEVLQAAETLRRAIRSGRAGRKALCRQVAARLVEDPAWDDIVHLELVTDKFDAIAYFSGDTAPIAKSRVHVRCRLGR